LVDFVGEEAALVLNEESIVLEFGALLLSFSLLESSPESLDGSEDGAESESEFESAFESESEPVAEPEVEAEESA
jgi:hypothetical protein